MAKEAVECNSNTTFVKVKYNKKMCGRDSLTFKYNIC